MTSLAATAPTYPPHVGSRLLLALARALNGDGAAGARRVEPLRSAEETAAPAETARGVALALRDTCRVVASDLAQRPEPRRPLALAERLCATAGEIGEVLALFDRTTEQMHRLASDALAAAPGTGAVEDGLTVVASEVRSLSLQTRRASRRVAEQVHSMHGAAAGPRAARAGAVRSEISWSQPAAAARRPAPAEEAPAARCEAAEFSLLDWLSRSGEAKGPARVEEG